MPTDTLEAPVKKKKKSGMTRQDAGRLGGKKTAMTHGAEFFRKIGRAGGKARGDKSE